MHERVEPVKKVLLGVFIALILLVGGCFAVVSAGVDAVDDAVKAEEANDKPKPVEVGKAFVHDGYEFGPGWKVVKDGLGGAEITGLKVTNAKDSTQTVMVTFTFTKGNEKLGEVECNAGELEAGQVSKLDCFSLDDGFPTGWTEIKVADMW